MRWCQFLAGESGPSDFGTPRFYAPVLLCSDWRSAGGSSTGFAVGEGYPQGGAAGQGEGNGTGKNKYTPKC